MIPANFKVDTNLTSILGDNYRSTEAAIKELVDNAWDADAVEVKISMPEPFDEEQIIIEDNGIGMTEVEIRDEYLFIARSRISRKGEYTQDKNRIVKGRKGIGKFAGLSVSNEMILISKAQGKKTTLKIFKNQLLKWSEGLEKLNLAIETTACSSKELGTTVILKQLNQNLHFPNPLRLSQLLITEYGRENGFKIYINDKLLNILDLKGISNQGVVKTPNAGDVHYKYTISEEKKNYKQAGIALRVRGKIIGKPGYFGLENDEEIPRAILKKIYAELEVDGLEEDILANWNMIIENSKKLEEVKNAIIPIIKTALLEVYSSQIKHAKSRLQVNIKKKLELFPVFKRNFVQQTLNQILTSYRNETKETLDIIISVVLKTLDKDIYDNALKNIQNLSIKEKSAFTKALSDFGNVELSVIGMQAKHRFQFLDFLEQLVQNNKTTQIDIRNALIPNLWILNDAFGLMSTNPSLDNIRENYLGKSFTTPIKHKSNIILCQNYKNDILLIELKHDSIMIGSEDEDQTIHYKMELSTLFPNSTVTIHVLGKNIDINIDVDKHNKEIIYSSYSKLISNARHRMLWLIKKMKDNHELNNV